MLYEPFETRATKFEFDDGVIVTCDFVIEHDRCHRDYSINVYMMIDILHLGGRPAVFRSAGL